MNWLFVVALRNDANQLLVLEDGNTHAPVFPGGALTVEPLPKSVAQQVEEATGFQVGGLHLSSVGNPRKDTRVHRFTAYVAGGRLREPAQLRFRSASWIAPSLIPKLQGVSDNMLELIKDLTWMYTRAP